MRRRRKMRGARRGGPRGVRALLQNFSRRVTPLQKTVGHFHKLERNSGQVGPKRNEVVFERKGSGWKRGCDSWRGGNRLMVKIARTLARAATCINLHTDQGILLTGLWNQLWNEFPGGGKYKTPRFHLNALIYRKFLFYGNLPFWFLIHFLPVHWIRNIEFLRLKKYCGRKSKHRVKVKDVAKVTHS